jgi:hypothetical protein
VGGRDRKTIEQREREHNTFLVSYDMKQVQAAEVSQRRTAVSSKCFQLYYTCSDRLLAMTLHPYSFHLFSLLTVTFPKLSVILRPLWIPEFRGTILCLCSGLKYKWIRCISPKLCCFLMSLHGVTTQNNGDIFRSHTVQQLLHSFLYALPCFI